MKKTIQLLVLLLFFWSNIKAETEPNDAWNQANVATLGSPGSGAITNGDVDWHSVILPEDGQLSVSWTSDNGEYIYCNIFDTLGVELFASNYTNSITSISKDGLAAGYYYIRFTAFYGNGTPTYTFTPSFVATGINNDSGDNDLYTNSSILNLNDSATGHIGYYHNGYDDLTDWWVLTTNADGRIDFTITSMNNQNVFAELFDGDGITKLAGSYTTSTANYSQDGLLPGIYYIRVRNFFTSEFAPYKLKNNLVLPPNTTEAGENNNFALNAVPININDSINGHIGYYYNGYDDLTDWYKFTPSEDGKIFFKLTSLNAQYVFAELFDGDTITNLAGSYTAGTITYSKDGAAKGAYYIRIRNFYNSEWSPYALVVTHEPTVPDDPGMNDTYTGAVVIQPGDSVTGHIGYAYNGYDDLNDWYQVTTNADGLISLKITSYNAANVFAELYDFDGTTQLTGSYTTSTATYTKDGLAAGTYYIHIRTFYASEFAPYALVVNLNPAPLTNDVEPNNYIPNALILPVNSSMTGHIGYYYNHYDDTTDVYSITLPEDGRLTVTMNPVYSQNVFATLYDNNGTTILFNNYSITTFSQTKDDLAAGTYYIRVRTYYQSEFSPYTLSCVFEPMNFPAEQAGNNNFAALATPLPANTAKTGHVNFYYNLLKDGLDWWVIGYDGTGAMTINCNIEQNHFNTLFPGIVYKLYADTAASPIASGNWLAQNNVLIVPVPVIGKYFLKIEDYFGSFGAYELSANYTENCANVIAITSSSQLPGCLGNIAYNVTGGLAPYSVQLFQNGNPYGAAVTTNGPVSFSNLPTGTYYAQSFSFGASGTCNNVSSNTVFSTPPAPVITPNGPLSFCSGGSVMLTSDVANSYLWSDGSTTQSITVNSTGDYSVTVYNAAGCENFSALTSVVVFNNPATPIITPASPVTICQGSSVMLSTATASSYAWSTGASSQSISVSTAGLYTVTITDGNNCSATSAATTVNEDPLLTWYADVDGDGFGNAASSTQDCSLPAGYVSNNTDCNDGNIFVYPGAAEQCNGIDDNCDGSTDEGCNTFTFYFDNDGDGYGDPGNSVTQSNPTPPSGYIAASGDCNDNNNAIHPGAAEACNNIDDNCNGLTDDGITFITYYADSDGDNYGNASVSQSTCNGAPIGYTSDNTDCNDNAVGINPGASEICNGVDDDCNGLTDDGLTFVTYYADSDGDNYGNASVSQSTCSGAPSGYTTDNTDCDDNNSALNPGATELCNGIDDNCNSLVDEGLTFVTYYADSDGDNYGDASTSQSTCSGAPSGYITDNTDCNDNAAGINPGALEICNGVDDNCNALTDDGLTFVTYYADSDGDNFGNASVSQSTCSGAPNGYVINNSDCDDNAAGVNPGATEICNSIDDNCDGVIDEGCNGCVNPSTADAGADQTICSGTDALLNGAVGGGATTGTWSTSGDGTFNPSVNDLNATYTPGANDILAGMVTLTLTSDALVNCTPAISSMDLNIGQSTSLGVINGPSQLCNPTGQTFTYSVSSLAGASSYNWTVPSGTIIMSGQGSNSIVVRWPFSSIHSGVNGDVCVYAVTSCGITSPSCMNVAIQLIAPVRPGSISGASKACAGDIEIYSIANVYRADTYTWSVPTGATILSGQGSNVISVSFDASYLGGDLTVSSSNACGTSPDRIKSLGRNILRAPGQIAGPKYGNCGATNIVYTCPILNGASSYTWSASAGINILSGQGSNSITVDFQGTFVGGSIIVYASNTCGTGANRVFNVYGAPEKPGTISGPVVMCLNSNNTYEVLAVTGTSNYIWTVPNHVQIVSGQGTKTLNVLSGSSNVSGYTISVKASNNCGTSSASKLENVSTQTCTRVGGATDLSVIAYPNPTHDLLNVAFESYENENVLVTLNDLSGRIVYTSNLTAKTGANKFNIDCATMSAGYYLLQIRSTLGLQSVPVIVE